jgi:glycosyltransferase involved in cell wall biosynthesis
LLIANCPPLNLLFLIPYPPGKAPSQRFRFEQYLGLLREQGVRCELRPFWTEAGWRVLYVKGRYPEKLWALLHGFLRRWALMWRLGRYDRVFVHREAAPIGPPLFEWIAAKWWKKPLIYDFDDAIWLPNTSAVNRPAAGLKNHGKVRRICRWATRISAGNAWLADYARQHNPYVAIVPTTIDTRYHDYRIREARPPNRRPVIGWTGTHSTARYLHLLAPVLADLARNFDFEFLVISNQPPDTALPNLVFEAWDGHREIDQLARIDIGVMPLEDNEWEKGKCGFKILQYMALGIAAVASPVGVNTEIIKSGINGYLCADAAGWKTALGDLLRDAGRRKMLGDAGRRTVEARYSVASNQRNFLELFR